MSIPICFSFFSLFNNLFCKYLNIRYKLIYIFHYLRSSIDYVTLQERGEGGGPQSVTVRADEDELTKLIHCDVISKIIKQLIMFAIFL